MVLFSANPSSLTRLDLEGELQDIVDELEGVGLEGVLALESQSATTPRTVQRALLVERPTVVHFSGHGRGRGARPPRRPGRAVRDLVPDPAPARTTGIMLHGDHDADLKVVTDRIVHMIGELSQ